MPDHLTTEELEEYALGRVCEPELTRTEEHLSWCLECTDRAEAVERFMASIIDNCLVRTCRAVQLPIHYPSGKCCLGRRWERLALSCEL